MVQETDQKVADRAQLESEEIPLSGEIGDFKSVPGVQSARYVLQPQDKASWAPAWQLNKDRFGTEYGIPTRLPKGQLDYYLLKKRPDGGRRFTLNEPDNVLAEPRFECFIGDCRKRVRERHLLVGHVEKIHSQEAQAYKPLLDTLRKAIVEDNPRLAALIGEIAKTPDQPIQAVSVAKTDVVEAPAGEAVASEAEVAAWTSSPPQKEYACGECPYRPPPGTKSPWLALSSHSRKHKR